MPERSLQPVYAHRKRPAIRSAAASSRSMRPRKSPRETHGFRVLSHRRKDSCVSPDLLPASKLWTLISSSRSGQWIPSPFAISFQWERSAGVPCESRGNQPMGTVMDLPSANSATSASSVTVTLCACTSVVSGPEVLIPCSQQKTLMLHDQSFYPRDLDATEAATPLKAYGV